MTGITSVPEISRSLAGLLISASGYWSDIMRIGYRTGSGFSKPRSSFTLME